MKIDDSFLTYVDNVFIKTLHGIMFDKLDEVDHFIGDNLFDKLQGVVKKLKDNNEIQMYEMTNIKSSSISNKYVKNDKFIVEISLVARYISYVVNSQTKELVSGDDKNRDEYNYILVFEKNLEANDIPPVCICPSCGSNMDINDSGKCGYCGSIFNLEDFGFIMVEMECND